MAKRAGRKPKPWYDKERGGWFVYRHGKKHNLGPDEGEADRRFHALMAAEPEVADSGSVAALLDGFLAYCKEHKAPATVRWYEDYINDFDAYLTGAGHAPDTMAAGKLTPRIVRTWVDKRGKAKRARITSVKSAYAWGHGEGWISANPIAAMKRPAATKREQVISLPEMKAILRASRKPMRELLLCAWDSGARPQELKGLKPWHVELDKDRCVIPAREAKGKKKNRVIYLTERAKRIIKRGMGRTFIFVNSRGRPWTASAVKCHFARLEETLGTRFCQYAFRHTFATRKLKEGISPIVVAELLGHADVSTLAKIYQHVAQDPAHLLDALRRK